MEAAAKIAVVEKYIEALTTKDMNLIREIFAEDATAEDPVGSEPWRGIAGVVKFYQKAFDVGVELEAQPAQFAAPAMRQPSRSVAAPAA